MMRYLQPLLMKPEYYELIERDINSFFYEILYKPLLRTIDASGLELQNAGSFVIEAIRKGQINYENGYFFGSFNSKITKELKSLGAKYSIMKRGFLLSPLPGNIQIAVADFQSIMQKLVNNLIRTLDDIQVEKIIDERALSENYGAIISSAETAFQKTIKSITIAPKFTEATKKIIADEWSNNLKLYIVGWTKANILQLRAQVQKNAYRGQRAEPLAKMIQANYGTSKTKAKFLARQETSLLMSKIRESRYKDIGSNEYKWNGADDERERPDHRVLNGKIFSWSNPPITNRSTGARNHPGEDFGCRCVAVPIIKGFNDGTK